MHSYHLMVEMPITTPRHVLSRCVFIPNKFPTLLAEREIIANALLLVRISPRTEGKDTKFFPYSQRVYLLFQVGDDFFLGRGRLLINREGVILK